MAGFYEELIPEVLEILTEFGADGIFVHKDDGTYNAASSTVVRDPEVNDPVLAAVFDVNEQFINGTSIRTGDKQIFMSINGTTSEPKTGDELYWGSEIYKIIQAKKIAPARISVLYELQGRKS